MENSVYWESMLTLSGEIGIGIAGFSSVIVTLAISGDEEWHFTRRTNLNMLLISSGYAIFFSILPFYLLEVGLDLSITWAVSSGSFFLIASGTLIYRLVRQSRAFGKSDSWMLLMTLFNLCISATNVFVWQVAWPLLTVVYWQLIISFLIFTSLLIGIGGMREPTKGEMKDSVRDNES